MNANNKTDPIDIGKESGEIQVELSTRFLKHFSEQLYSSPQKAFEELISNGWDAGADYVDVRISDNLDADDSTLVVLDNGASMNQQGLTELWHIAASPKENVAELHGRPVIGKFGIGKLATYVLANKLTYICKASDGVIRRVTMDYSREDLQSSAESTHLIRDLTLKTFEVEEGEVFSALESVAGGADLVELIKNGVPRPTDSTIENEFGGKNSTYQRPPKGSWTLVILSDLKPVGKSIKIGVLKRMLAAALPIGSEILISVNGESLESSKTDTPIHKQWVIGNDLEFDSFDVAEDPKIDTSTEGAVAKKEIKIKKRVKPYPHVIIPEVGEVSGSVKLYKSRISTGKSEVRGHSNGFLVNVLGRIVNQKDPSFGEENLSHGAWACFRMTVRADGLNECITTSREQFIENNTLRIFKAFLRKVFNSVRNEHDSDLSAILPDGGDVLLKSLGVISLSPLRNVVAEALTEENAMLPGLFDEAELSNKKSKRKSWIQNTGDNIKSALNEVKFDKLEAGDSFVKFRLSDNSIVVNKSHPFVEEHSKTKAEKTLLRTIGMVNLLTDMYAMDINVPQSKLKKILEYREKVMRFRALQQRQSGTYIARLLLQTQHDSKNFQLLERVVSDALRYLGFEVQDLAKSGEPEGIARAFPIPTSRTPTEEDPHPSLYSFLFDAKASKHEAARTGNIKLDGVVQHRKKFKADYALVVAPGFQDGSLKERCLQQSVTPIAAQDLGKLLEYTVESGAIPLTKLEEMFQFHDPEKVAAWVVDLEQWLADQRSLTLDVFVKALKSLKGEIPDVLSASTIAYVCRDKLKVPKVTNKEVIAVATGLSILVPDLVGIEGEKIVVNASARRVASAVESQLEQLHKD